jgi:hypothetical protein
LDIKIFINTFIPLLPVEYKKITRERKQTVFVYRNGEKVKKLHGKNPLMPRRQHPFDKAGTLYEIPHIFKNPKNH